jgi:hypothetical protein
MYFILTQIAIFLKLRKEDCIMSMVYDRYMTHIVEIKTLSVFERLINVRLNYRI